MKKLAIIFFFSLFFSLSAILDLLPRSFAGTPNDFQFGAITGGITNTPHNLGATGANINTNDTSEVCVFCHTPHNGTTLQPLWNRETTADFKVYGTTMAGTTVTDDTISPSSLACLSCHDGVTSFDTLVNASGKGGGGGTADLGWILEIKIITL